MPHWFGLYSVLSNGHLFKLVCVGSSGLKIAWILYFEIDCIRLATLTCGSVGIHQFWISSVGLALGGFWPIAVLQDLVCLAILSPGENMVFPPFWSNSDLYVSIPENMRMPNSHFTRFILQLYSHSLNFSSATRISRHQDSYLEGSGPITLQGPRTSANPEQRNRFLIQFSPSFSSLFFSHSPYF